MNDDAPTPAPEEEDDDDSDDGADDEDDEDDEDDDIGDEELDDELDGDDELVLLAPVPPLLPHAATTRLAATRAADQATFLAITLVPFYDGGTCHLWAHCRIALMGTLGIAALTERENSPAGREQSVNVPGCPADYAGVSASTMRYPARGWVTMMGAAPSDSSLARRRRM